MERIAIENLRSARSLRDGRNRQRSDELRFAVKGFLREAEVRGLAARGHDVPVYVGMKHWTPWIADVVARMKADGITRVVCVVLAPHYSRFSVGGYQRYLFEGMHKHDVKFDVDFVGSKTEQIDDIMAGRWRGR